MRLIIALILSFPFTSSAEDPEDFYLSCKDQEGIFGGKDLIATARYFGEQKILYITTFSKKAERNKRYIKSNLVDRYIYFLSFRNDLRYGFGEITASRTYLDKPYTEFEIHISREDLDMYFNNSPKMHLNCSKISMNAWSNMETSFSEREKKYLRRQKYFLENKNQI